LDVESTAVPDARLEMAVCQFSVPDFEVQTAEKVLKFVVSVLLHLWRSRVGHGIKQFHLVVDLLDLQIHILFIGIGKLTLQVGDE